MKMFTWLIISTLLSGAVAIQKREDHVLYVRQATTKTPTLPSVPGYNFSMPIDHFTSSNTQTYNNRYWVNDTYYKPGGPVILYDGGEAGMTDYTLALVMAEWNGTQSGAMRLAAKLNAVVIAWEHRYYGYSQPFAVNETTGQPVQGAAAYKYLTLEQALEDVVYFANRFNTTTLPKNSNVKSTVGLDPYATPWIFVGGSYPGARAAWIRQRNPEIFYASWSSSAPVQARMDGSIYWNQVSRALPANCTKDLQSVSAWLDQTLSSNDQFSIRTIKASLYLTDPTTSASSDVTPAFQISNTDVMNGILQSLVSSAYQGEGPGKTLQVFCNYMEQFDGASYLRGRQQLTSSADEFDISLVAFQNQGRAAPNATGIYATNGQYGGQVGYAALVYALRRYNIYRNNLAASQQSVDVVYTREAVDGLSWTWQTLSQFGYFQWTNTSTQFFASKYLDSTEFYQRMLSFYPGFKSSDFPKSINTTYPLSLGGWTTKASNTMFTNGELDPWRAFGVSSQEKAAGAPLRPLTTDIPKCNTPTSGNNVFGLVYAGAVHCEDLIYNAANNAHASEESVKPYSQGVDLFVKAWSVWQPCFNTSRDTMRNGKGVDGNGNTANGTSISSSTSNSGSGSGSASGSSSGGGSKNAASRASVYGVWSAFLLGSVSVLFALL